VAQAMPAFRAPRASRTTSAPYSTRCLGQAAPSTPTQSLSPGRDGEELSSEKVQAVPKRRGVSASSAAVRKLTECKSATASVPEPEVAVKRSKLTDDLWEHIWASVEGSADPAAADASSTVEQCTRIPIGDAPANTEEWPCPRCTLFNKISAAKCAACGGARPRQTQVHSPPKSASQVEKGKRDPPNTETEAFHGPDGSDTVGGLAIEVYRWRLVGKQPPPQPRAKFRGSRGHYDVLGLRRDASAAEVRMAYRRQALATHPDKGGDPNDFHRVVAAFEELADETRRAEYDRNLGLFRCRDGTTTATAASEDADSAGQEDMTRQWNGAAHAAHFAFLACAPEAWSRRLADMHAKELQALRNLLQRSKAPAASAADRGRGKETGGKEHCGAGATRGAGREARGCIEHHKSGYRVVVTWASLAVSTGFTRSLAQAIDWQIALASLQGAAQARTRREGGRGATSGGAEPLTEEEVVEVLASDPDLRLEFTATVLAGGRRGKKVCAPSVPDLHLALDFRHRLCAALFKGAKHLSKEVCQAQREAGAARRERMKREQLLLGAVTQELQSRAGTRTASKGGAAMPQESAHGCKRKATAAAVRKRPAAACAASLEGSTDELSLEVHGPIRQIRKKPAAALAIVAKAKGSVKDILCVKQKAAPGGKAERNSQQRQPPRNRKPVATPVRAARTSAHSGTRKRGAPAAKSAATRPAQRKGRPGAWGGA